jgi:predicted protein tyrosine phosphatase
MPFMIYICGLLTVPAAAARVQPRHLISLTDPETPAPRFAGVAPGRHLKLEFHDVDAPLPGLVPPDGGHIERIIAFARGWDELAPLLVHCHAGASRSTAAALIVAAARTAGRAGEAARLLRARAPHACPNRRMIALADAQLGLAGRLVAAVDAMGPAVPLGNAGPLVHLALAP